MPEASCGPGMWRRSGPVLEKRSATNSHRSTRRPSGIRITDKIKEGISALGGWIGNATSDAVLRLKRRTLSHGAALFLGDVFVYLRQREVAGAEGTRQRLFAPIIADLIKAAKIPRQPKEPFVVVGHSLGGVLLYDILTDPPSLQQITAEVPEFRIDLWLTVGSQPGFFADLGLYSDKPRPTAKLKRPDCVSNWLNVYDFTDVFSFLCAPFFDGVDDFGYDTKIDLFEAHSAYFLRPKLLQTPRNSPKRAWIFMTRVFERPQPGGGTRVLVLGASAYPHALEGSLRIPKLTPISSAGRSALDFADTSSNDWRDRLVRPLMSVDLLVDLPDAPGGAAFQRPDESATSSARQLSTTSRKPADVGWIRRARTIV